MIIHIPHASTDTLDKVFHSNIDNELLRMTDRYTDELFYYEKAISIIAPISRLICDMERFEDDMLEIMAEKGMGVCYTRDSFSQPLRDVSMAEKEWIIETYYRHHHQTLEDAVQYELDKQNYALIIDGHSFSNIPLPHENDQNSSRPDICIGSDTFHTPRWIVETIVMEFLLRGYSVKLNSPFEGTLVPIKFYHQNSNVYSVMIELNRDLYMDSNGEKNSKFSQLQSDMNEVLSKISENPKIIEFVSEK